MLLILGYSLTMIFLWEAAPHENILMAFYLPFMAKRIVLLVLRNWSFLNAVGCTLWPINHSGPKLLKWHKHVFKACGLADLLGGPQGTTNRAKLVLSCQFVLVIKKVPTVHSFPMTTSSKFLGSCCQQSFVWWTFDFLNLTQHIFGKA